MTGAWDSFKKWAMEDTPAPAQTPVPVPPTQVTAPVAPTPVPAPVVVIPGFADPAQKDKFLGFFNQALEEASATPGPNFWAFVSGIRNLSASGLTEDMRFLTSLSLFQAQHVTAQQLLDSSKTFVAVIEEQVRDFQGSIQAKTANEVEAVRAQAKECADQAQAKAEQIQQLTKEIQELGSKAQELLSQAGQAEVTINNTIQSFNSAKAVIDGEVGTVITRLQAQIQPAAPTPGVK